MSLHRADGGAKMANIDGHGKSYHNNLNVYANVYGKTCNWQWPGWWPEEGQEEHYFNNTCILDEGQNYIKMLDGCCGSYLTLRTPPSVGCWKGLGGMGFAVSIQSDPVSHGPAHCALGRSFVALAVVASNCRLLFLLDF